MNIRNIRQTVLLYLTSIVRDGLNVCGLLFELQIRCARCLCDKVLRDNARHKQKSKEKEFLQAKAMHDLLDHAKLAAQDECSIQQSMLTILPNEVHLYESKLAQTEAVVSDNAKQLEGDVGHQAAELDHQVCSSTKCPNSYLQTCMSSRRPFFLDLECLRGCMQTALSLPEELNFCPCSLISEQGHMHNYAYA